MKKVGILGMGKMGEALVRFFKKNGYLVSGTCRSKERAAALSKQYKISVGTDNAALVKACDIVILAVKPHQAEEVLRKVSSHLKGGKILVSVCASITLKQLATFSGGHRKIIRAMPNLPALIGEGMTVLTSASDEETAELKWVRELFESVGKVTTIEEKWMDGVTGLSACGPAFVFLILEALSEAGVKVGIPRKTAVLLAAQTMLGSAKMVLDGVNHPAALKDEVTTPAGCTTDGLMALEDGRIRATLIRAVVAATEKSASLRNAR